VRFTDEPSGAQEVLLEERHRHGKAIGSSLAGQLLKPHEPEGGTFCI
jgi:hypothetical protein